MPVYPNPYPFCYNRIGRYEYVPFVEYPPKSNYPNYPGMPTAQVINTVRVYPDHLWMQVQETKATLQYYFSYGNLLQDPYLQSRMNRSLWVPLKEIHKFNKIVFLGISFRQLQAFATEQMSSYGSSFDLDKTKTLIRPNWGKESTMNFTLSCERKISARRRTAKARRIINKALKSVANSEQISSENEDVNLFQVRAEKDGSVIAHFNAPGIQSLIKEFMDEYSEPGWGVQITGMKDSTAFAKDA